MELITDLPFNEVENIRFKYNTTISADLLADLLAANYCIILIQVEKPPKL